MPLPDNLSRVLWSLEGLTDREKGLIEREFNAANVLPGKWILADINIVAIRLKREGRITSEQLRRHLQAQWLRLSMMFVKVHHLPSRRLVKVHQYPPPLMLVEASSAGC